jgi:hypothetical protein
MRDLARGFAFALSVFAIVHLHQFVFRDQRSNLLRGQFEEPPCKTPEFVQLLSADVASLILGEAVQKHRPIAAPESDHCPVAAALSLSGSRQALFDQTAPEVGAYKPRLDAAYGLAKSRVANPFLALKPRKTLQFVYLGQTAPYQ